MMFLRHFIRLIRELFGFAREHKAWWLVPLMIFLAVIAVVIVAGHGAAPFIYTLF
ncbi:MAG: DUF5989 family protein [Kiritimatiellia bacterium]